MFGLHKVGVHLTHSAHAGIVVADSTNDGGRAVVAKNAPAIPRIVVRMKPLGLFGPGDRRRAIMPATKPTTRIQIIAISPLLSER